MGLPCRIPKDGPQPLLRFKVRVRRRDNKAPYYWCSIWPNLSSARARMEALGNEHEAGYFHDTMGACMCWISYKGKKDEPLNQAHHKMLPELGEIVLAAGWVNDNIVPHECCHAAFRYREAIERFCLPDNETPEERFCLTVGWMTAKIHKEWREYNAIKEIMNEH